MGNYTITTGQNLYDIAMHIHGSIEGIVDLMINNSELSLDDKLQAGAQLIYTDEYVINGDIVAYNTSHMTIPASGEQHVYYKSSDYPQILELILDNKKTSAGIVFSGTGKIEIDWGDNTSMEVLILENVQKGIFHSFDSNISDKRRIRIYSEDVHFRKLDISAMQALSVYCNRPVSVEKFILTQAAMNISWLSLIENTYEMDITGLTTSDLLPLLRHKSLMNLDLRKISIKQQKLDEYLIALVRHYEGRRNCNIILTMQPSGSYEEPGKDENDRYIITSGMEAVWIITHEEAWNSAGFWKFQIKDQIYTTEP